MVPSTLHAWPRAGRAIRALRSHRWVSLFSLGFSPRTELGDGAIPAMLHRSVRSRDHLSFSYPAHHRLTAASATPFLQDVLTDLSAESEVLDVECEVQDRLAHKV